MMQRVPPFKLHRWNDRYARRIAFSPHAWFPAVILKVVMDCERAILVAKEEGTNIMSVFLKAIATAQRAFPELHYYALGGKLVWAGPHTRVGVVIEEEEMGGCANVVIEDAETMELKAISRALREAIVASRKRTPSAWERLANRFPRGAFYLKRHTGLLARELRRHAAPLLLSNLSHPEISEMISAGASSCAILTLAGVQAGKCVLHLSFNHEVANARPYAAFLARIKEVVERAEGLTQP